MVLGDLKLKTASLDLGDIDGDGDIDIGVANGRHWPAQNQVFFNNGSGIFTVSTNLDALSSTSYSTELGDFKNYDPGNNQTPDNPDCKLPPAFQNIERDNEAILETGQSFWNANVINDVILNNIAIEIT